MAGFNLPPGVNVSDIPGCGDDEDGLICRNCDESLPQRPYKIREWKEKLFCSGELQESERHYDESLIEISGDEYRGETYVETWFECEEVTGLNTPHDPHYYEVLSGVFRYFRCDHCGETTVIEEV